MPPLLRSGLSLLLAAACTAQRPSPYIVQPPPGETLTSVPGPLPDFGPFTGIPEALVAACPVLIRQPHAHIPVSKDHQHFSVYWRTASEYCAWLYSVDDEHVEMSLMATSPIQDDPSRRRCDLPAHVSDRRQPQAAVTNLVMMHNHPAGSGFSLTDLDAIAGMARIHGATTRFQGKLISISIAVFFGRERDGTPECAGFLLYAPARSDEIMRYTVEHGLVRGQPIARVVWPVEGTPQILDIEERP